MINVQLSEGGQAPFFLAPVPVRGAAVPVPLLAKSEVFGTSNSALSTQNFVSRLSPYFLPRDVCRGFQESERITDRRTRPSEST
jgi:hypothetical protein